LSMILHSLFERRPSGSLDRSCSAAARKSPEDHWLKWWRASKRSPVIESVRVACEHGGGPNPDHAGLTSSFRMVNGEEHLMPQIQYIIPVATMHCSGKLLRADIVPLHRFTGRKRYFAGG
jgi:hypothetical protein